MYIKLQAITLPTKLLSETSNQRRVSQGSLGREKQVLALTRMAHKKCHSPPRYALLSGGVTHEISSIFRATIRKALAAMPHLPLPPECHDASEPFGTSWRAPVRGEESSCMPWFGKDTARTHVVPGHAASTRGSLSFYFLFSVFFDGLFPVSQKRFSRRGLFEFDASVLVSIFLSAHESRILSNFATVRLVFRE